MYTKYILKLCIFAARSRPDPDYIEDRDEDTRPDYIEVGAIGAISFSIIQKIASNYNL